MSWNPSEVTLRAEIVIATESCWESSSWVTHSGTHTHTHTHTPTHRQTQHHTHAHATTHTHKTRKYTQPHYTQIRPSNTVCLHYTPTLTTHTHKETETDTQTHSSPFSV